MARKTSKSSSLLPDEDQNFSPSSRSRNLSLYEKLPVFSAVRNKTEGEKYIQHSPACCIALKAFCSFIAVYKALQATVNVLL